MRVKIRNDRSGHFMNRAIKVIFFLFVVIVTSFIYKSLLVEGCLSTQDLEVNKDVSGLIKIQMVNSSGKVTDYLKSALPFYEPFFKREFTYNLYVDNKQQFDLVFSTSTISALGKSLTATSSLNMLAGGSTTQVSAFSPARREVATDKSIEEIVVLVKGVGYIIDWPVQSGASQSLFGHTKTDWNKSCFYIKPHMTLVRWTLFVAVSTALFMALLVFTRELYRFLYFDIRDYFNIKDE